MIDIMFHPEVQNFGFTSHLKIRLILLVGVWVRSGTNLCDSQNIDDSFYLFDDSYMKMFRLRLKWFLI